MKIGRAGLFCSGAFLCCLSTFCSVPPSALCLEPAPMPTTPPPVAVETNTQPDAAAIEPVSCFPISHLEIRGDTPLLDRLDLSRALRSDTVGKTLTEKQMLDVATTYQDRCTKAGYYLARIRVVPADFSQGILTYEVDQGRIGRMSFYDGSVTGATASDIRSPFAGKYYSETQLRRQLRVMREDDAFDYNDFYRAVFAVNAHPDVKMDTNLRLRKDLSTGIERRYADMEFFVREGTPFHGVVEVKNTGTDSTDEWRTSITLQHLNLTRHNDILTINTLSSVDLTSLLSFAGSYHRPFYLGNGGALTVYGGYSDVTAEEIVPEIDLIGTGWFACLQASCNLVSNNRHLLAVAVSVTRRTVENTLSMQDACGPDGPLTQTDRATLVPMAAALNYSSVKPDRWGGRNFLTSQTAFNAGSALGGSDSEELAAQRFEAQAGYVIERLQAARLEPLFGRRTKEGVESGSWILFVKADGQIASGALVPAEQKAVGGMDSVRGYQERESLGDDGVSGTIELRTPLVSPSFRSLFGARGRESKGKEAGDGAVQLQFVAFLDGAYVSLKEQVEGSDSSQSLAGAGIGFRLAINNHFQLKFDWGLPLVETAASESSGRGHLSLQAQF